jgi:DNA-binding NtrC family response regulator
LILVVDDQWSIRTVVSTMLRKMVGARVVAVSSSAAGLRMARRHEFDLVITDLVRKATGGLAFTRAIKKAQPSLPVIVFSGSLDCENVQAAMRLGASFCLLKGCNHEVLIGVINQVLKRAPGEA